MPAATDALRAAPVEATVIALSADGGVAPWSTEETNMASIILPMFSAGSSPLNKR